VLAAGLVGERELDVRPGDGDERPRLRRAAVQRRELGVDHGDEVEIAAIQIVGEPAAVALTRERDIPDDAMRSVSSTIRSVRVSIRSTYRPARDEPENGMPGLSG
jgi:hypothetical protein